MKQSENKLFYKQIYKHPLFVGVDEQEFSTLMDACELKSYPKFDKVLYSKTPREGLLLILKGMAEVFVAGSENSDHQEVLEVLETGDMIGFSSLADFLGEKEAQQTQYQVQVRAVEDSVCLHIPFTVMEARWHEDIVRDFILRQAATRLRDIYASLAEQVQLASEWGESDPFIRRIQDIMNQPVITVYEKDSVQAVAKKMVAHSTSSVIVVSPDETLKGIITEKDLVQRVLAKGGGQELAAEEIMTKSPITIPRDAYYYEALSSFLMNGMKHLPVVEKKKAIGMVTLSDLLQKKNRGTLQVIRAIEEATLKNVSDVHVAIYEVLFHLLKDEIPTVHTLEIITKLYDRLVRHCLELALQKLEEEKGPPPVPFSWYMMGSGGRGEQFMLTDQDHFLVYEDPVEEEKEQTAAYFERLGAEIVATLELAGYRRCEGEMMASASLWRGSLSSWRERLRGWGLRATNENILLGQNFLSFRFLSGEDVLHDSFVKMVKELLTKSRIFLYRMAEQEKERPVPVIDHPMRAIFRMKRDHIDIKQHALFPLHHCLQLLSAQQQIVEGTPLDKIRALAKKGVISGEMAENLHFAYEAVLSIRLNEAVSRYQKGEAATSVVKFAHLRTREKDELIRALKTIRSLQQHTLGAFGM